MDQAGLKASLSAAVEEKQRLTRKRLKFKLETRAAKDLSEARQRVIALHWRECREQREWVRLIGLSLAFVRGQRYWHVERNTKEVPAAIDIARYGDLDVSAVQAWIDAPIDTKEMAEWSEHIKQTKAAVRERKALRRRPEAAE